MTVGKNILIKTAIEIAAALIIIFLGWELISSIYQPKGSNWMWLMELKVHVVYLILIAVLGNVALYFLKRKRLNKGVYSVLVLQLVILLIVGFYGYDLRPFRSLFLFASSVIVLLLGWYFFNKKMINREFK